MSLLKHRFDSEPFRDRAIALLEGVNEEEVQSWYHHPCTQSLLASLEADLCDVSCLWLSGAYANETADMTVQMETMARGKAAAVADHLQHIEDIKNLELRGDIDGDSA